ncbi:MAG: sugar ABC transporter ATP-binding protein [Bilifractor sp.]
MSANPDIILSVQNVTKRFPGVLALDHVSFDIQKGTVHGVVGENGAGKSTLMKILSSVYKKDEGVIYFNGKEMNPKTPMESLRLGLSIIYQELNLVNYMSVGENIFLGRFKEMKSLENIHKQARKLLDSIGCHFDTHTKVGELPVSDRQMVEICKALSFDSKLIIMDEPSTSLTGEEMEKLTKIIHDLKEKGITIIYISHKLDEIFDLCDKVTIMRDGQVIDTGDIGNYTRADLIEKMVGRKIENEYPPRPDCAGETVLEVKNITTRKLHGISFIAKKGEIVGFAGLDGAGRTETMRAIFGADRMKAGEIYLHGKKIEIKSPKDAIRNKIGFITEDRKEQGLCQSFPVGTNITMAAFDHFSSHGIFNKEKEKEIIDRQIEKLRVKTPSPNVKIRTLSGGNQQKCLIARWLETDPEILIMDEPTKGIDVGSKYEIYLLMKQMAEEGRTVLLVSSELPELINMSNRIYVLADGNLAGELSAEEANEISVMSLAFGGKEAEK